MGIAWADDAKKRLEKVPSGFMRNMTLSRIESFAQEKGLDLITLDIVEGVLGKGREAMNTMMGGAKMQVPPPSLYICRMCGYVSEGAIPDACPVCGAGRQRFELISKDSPSTAAEQLQWMPDALERLKKIPEGFMRDMTRWRIEKMARERGLAAVTSGLMQEKFDYWAKGSAGERKKHPWAKEAEEKIDRIPPVVRGMVIKEIETLAEREGVRLISMEFIEKAMALWGSTMEFHSDQAMDDGFIQELREEVFSHEAVNHPFLERFREGGLSEEQVRIFALHYYQHAKMFSHYIANIIPSIPYEGDRMVLVRNLSDEYGNLDPGKTHPALFRKFLAVLGFKERDWEGFMPIPEVTNYVDRMIWLTRHQPFLIGLGAVGPGVEWVIPTMFKKIVDGLVKSINIENDNLEYWTSHIVLDVKHGDEATTVLMNYLDGKENQDMVRTGAMKSLEARKLLWDGFERILRV